MNAAPDMATFARLVNSQFRLRLAGDTTAEAELVELRQGHASPSFEQFSLLFHAPSGTPAEQRIYTLEHTEAGIFELFLVPIGRTDSALLLEAVISRRLERASGGD